MAAAGPRPQPSRSWWLDNLPAAGPVPLERPPESADVVVIGCGMTGTSVAYWLRRLYNRDCLVLDARGVAGGATGRNGGHLWARPGSTFETETTRELLEFIEQERVDCDLVRGGTAALERRAQPDVEFHDGSGDPEDAQGEDWGGAGVEEWDESECRERLQTDVFVAATHYPGAAQFFPAKVAAALLRHSGATLAAPVRALAIVEADDGAPTVQTDVGDVRAAVVVVATNGWAAELLPELSPYLHAARNQVIMTRPLAGIGSLGVGGLSVDDGARELYAIVRPDGRVCLGGARAIEPDAAVGNSDDATLSEPVGAYLRQFLSENFPALGFANDALAGAEVEAEWTGILGFTSDGRPICGWLPGRRGVMVGAGFCGHGMPQCFGFGKNLAMMVDESFQRSAASVGDQGVAEEERQKAPPQFELHPFILGPANIARFFERP